MKTPVALCGTQGYAGQQLAKILLQHPNFELVACFSRESNPSALYAMMPNLQSVKVLPLANIELHSHLFEVLLLATPIDISMQVMAKLTHTSLHMIDLSGAFRLPEEDYLPWYGLPHSASELLPQCHYGLSPWVKYPTKLAMKVANPGCYATCALMALLPLLKNNIIQHNNIIIDAKSGASGAGRHTSLNFCDINNNFFPYKIGKHQHTPEIQHIIQQHTQQTAQVLLTTQMLPVNHGIAMTIYADANKIVSASILDDIATAYHTAYHQYPLCKYAAINNDDESRLLQLKSVVGTPYTHINYYVIGNKVVIIAFIDNLLKGAASQAIENLNALYQLPLFTGLLAEALI